MGTSSRRALTRCPAWQFLVHEGPAGTGGRWEVMEAVEVTDSCLCIAPLCPSQGCTCSGSLARVPSLGPGVGRAGRPCLTPRQQSPVLMGWAPVLKPSELQQAPSGLRIQPSPLGPIMLCKELTSPVCVPSPDRQPQPPSLARPGPRPAVPVPQPRHARAQPGCSGTLDWPCVHTQGRDLQCPSTPCTFRARRPPGGSPGTHPYPQGHTLTWTQLSRGVKA